MNSKVKTGLIAGGGLVLGIIIGSAGGGDATPTAGAPQVTVTQTVPVQGATGPATTVTVTAPAPAAAPAPAPAAEAAPAGSTCDAAREAILTGSKADITKALKALQADKTADSTAREYARYYTGRDAGNETMQEMDIQLIQMSCSL